MPVVGTKIDEHHVNYMLMYDMLSGIRVTVRDIAASCTTS